MSKRIFPYLSLFITFIFAVVCGAEEKQLGRQVSERLIVQIDLSSKVDTPQVSPDNRHVAYAIQTDNKCSVVVDGKEEKRSMML